MKVLLAPTTLLVLLGGIVVGAVAGAAMTVVWLAPLALLAGVAVAFATWRRPLVGAVVVVALVPALSGLSRGLAVPGLKISELLLVTCVAALVLRRPDRYRPLSGADVALLLFAVTGLAFAVWHHAQGTSPLESVLRIGLQPTFLFLAWWAASRGVQRPGDLVVVLRWLLLVSIVPAGLAVLQWLAVPGVNETLVALTSDGFLADTTRLSASRVTGPFTIWHSLGGYLLVPTVVAAVLLLRRDRRVLSPRWLALVLLVDLSALVLAVTVTLLVWLPVAFLVAAFLARRLGRGLALAAALAVLSILLFPDVLADRIEEQGTQTRYTQGGVLPQTLEYRILVWERDYLPLLDTAAVAGLGNDLPPDILFESTENQYITLALRGGVGLVLAMAVAVGAMTVRALRHARAPAGRSAAPGSEAVARAAAQAAAGILVFLPVGMFIWPYLTNAGMAQALLAFAGAALALEPHRTSRLVRQLAPATGPRSAGQPAPTPRAMASRTP